MEKCESCYNLEPCSILKERIEAIQIDLSDTIDNPDISWWMNSLKDMQTTLTNWNELKKIRWCL